MMREHRIFWKLYFQVVLQPAVYKLVEEKIDQIYVPLLEILNNYFKSMGFENPEMESLIFGALLDGVSMDYVMKPDLFPLDAIQEEIIKRYCNKKK